MKHYFTNCTGYLQETGAPYNFPLFSSFPIPREYSPNLGGRSAIKQGKQSNTCKYS